jgi:hypothetical protein
MLRRLLNLLATVLLLLGFTSIVLWIRSYQNEEAVCYGHPNESVYYQLTSDRGLLAWESIDLSGVPNEMLVEYLRGLWAYSLPDHPAPVGWATYYQGGRVQSRLVFIQAEGPRGLASPRPGVKAFRPVPAEAIAVPYWTVTGLLLLLPIGRFASLAQQRRRRAEGLCPKCGEPLDENEQCPKCGITET